MFFFTVRPSGKYLRTARGVVDINGDEIIVTTKNSRYHFKIDDSLFSDMEIEYLIRNCLNCILDLKNTDENGRIEYMDESDGHYN